VALANQEQVLVMVRQVVVRVLQAMVLPPLRELLAVLVGLVAAVVVEHQQEQLAVQVVQEYFTFSIKEQL
jgi:Na+-translocating ferredoxin:NAD+ oxidoreductase RnfD subunit